ncbi:MAG: hypothetical protein LBV00_05850 [Propionibacteriaceae bacterium]|jgi:hypothetical protein|nr:hypothetical protein [Propionibacteriaceae bacterium]
MDSPSHPLEDTSVRASDPGSEPRTFDPATYREFRYDGYTIATGSDTVTSTFSLVGEDTVRFTETIELPGLIRDEGAAEPVMRLLALASGLSYYKAAAPPSIRVSFGLTDHERDFLTHLIRGGLGEYAYRNDLPHALTPLIEAEQRASLRQPQLVDADAPPLIGVGGGKDSIVSIEACKRLGSTPVLFSVNQYPAITRCVDVAQCPYVSARRLIDPTLFEINRLGAYNGHVPVTAINSLIGVLTSHALGLGPTVFSNEASANDGNLNWRGFDINHQWSKSLAFEDLLRDCLEAANDGPPPYFSLLRGLNELQIAHRFSRLTQYFRSFTSCNKAFRLDQTLRRSHWCCQCPKCLFVYLVLAAWLPRDTMVDIFGQDILGDPSHEQEYAEILGLEGHKPFECVGEATEARAALRLAALRPQWQSSACVQALLPRIGVDTEPDQGLGADTSNIPAAYLAALASLS